MQELHNNRAHYHHGYLVVVALVFGAIFFTIMVASLSYFITLSKYQTLKVDRERALDVAEAGLDYYKWYLAHFPNDLTNGTATSGPYIHEYSDPEGGRIGEFSLDVTGNLTCGDVASIDIESTGRVDDAPALTRTVFGRYARPTVSEYAYILNSNVWAGADRTIVGPYHSNGGIRMDGTNMSTVSSGVETWLCTSSFGCSPNQTQNGVWGGGPNSAFWSWPSPPINFTGLTVDLAAMKTKAQSSGRYFPPSGAFGYHLVLQSNNTFNLYTVTNTANVWGYTIENGWVLERHVITAETLLGNYSIPPACSIIFAEDKLWINGVVNTKVSIAAANITTAGVDPSIILPNSISYGTATSTGLLAIAEQDVLVGLDTPNTMTLEGIFIAQNGRFGRNHYCTNDCSPVGGDQGLPGTYDPYVTRSTLTVNGTIVTNGREGTKWTNAGVFISGYATRSNSYDRDLVSNPPPLTPYVSDTYKFIEWREIN